MFEFLKRSGQSGAGQRQEAREADYSAEVRTWMDRAFPGRRTHVWSDPDAADIRVDVCAMEPAQEQPYWVLYTVGMSALPMALEHLETDERYDYLRRAELMMYLSAREMPKPGNEPEPAYHPVRLLRALAKMPHRRHTWLGAGHSVPNGQPPRAIGGTGFTGVVLFLPDEGNGPCRVLPVPTQEGGQVMLYLAVPVYPQEMDVKLRRGAETLEADLRLVPGGLGFFADPDRPATSIRKEALL